MKPSTVYFWNLRASMKAPFDMKMKKMFKSAKVNEHLRTGDLAAIKVHFGEMGVTGFLRPIWVRPLVDFLKKTGAEPFLTDTSTLYAGERGQAVKHHICAARNGWDPYVTGAPVIIADGLKGRSETEVHVGGKHIETAYIGRDIAEADSMVTFSHFKGHELAGYGGAVKNLGMGCASKKGKMQQHCTTGPIPKPDHCTGCNVCVENCAAEALSLDDDRKIVLDEERCTGCGGCFVACQFGAIEVNWKIGVQEFLERMCEYALAVLKTKERPCLHFNFVVDVTPECDCTGYSDAPLCPDLGVLASWDPVAVDQAGIDMVNEAPACANSKLPELYVPGQNKFIAVHNHVPEDMGLAYAEEIGLGTRQYKLVKI